MEPNLLIGFYYKQEFPPFAGMKAFLVNRVGDFGFLLGMLLLLLTFGSLRYSELLPRVAGAVEYGGTPLAMAIALLLFVGATGKSAQIPLHTWLPDAMAGPTPVSALIHAATMVTAGVYLVIRANVIFQAAPQPTLGQRIGKARSGAFVSIERVPALAVRVAAIETKALRCRSGPARKVASLG